MLMDPAVATNKPKNTNNLLIVEFKSFSAFNFFYSEEFSPSIHRVRICFELEFDGVFLVA